ncbi:MAG: LPS assembly lipoprotein LptE [Thermodesulfobacteriota bacterium]
MTLLLNRTRILTITFLCIFLLLGCGYQMVGKETHVPPGLNSLAIPTFKNLTFEPGIEVPFTQAFLREFIQDRRVNVVDRAKADSVLEGSIRYFWEEKGVSEVQFFRASSQALTNEANKAIAFQQLGGLVAGRIRNRFFYNF